MKQSTRILITLGVYILLIAGVIHFVNVHVDNKDKRLRKEFYNNYKKYLEELLDKPLIQVDFSGEDISYNQYSIPPGKEYNNISSLYCLTPEYDDDETYTGWCFRKYKAIGGNSIILYHLYPEDVGYKKQPNSINYRYMSVEHAINITFDYLTTKCKDVKYLSEVSPIVEDRMNSITNEYYGFFDFEEKDSVPRESLQQRYHTISDCSSMFDARENDFYKIWWTEKPKKVWNGCYDYWNDPKGKERRRIILIGSIIASILVLPFLFYNIRQYKREKKWANETLKEKLCRVSNPKNFWKSFWKPFDEVKVATANELYSKINQTDETDVETLKALRKEVAERLGINFIDAKKQARLKLKCHPKNFMKPYDKEKVDIATKLYNKLRSSVLDVDELEEIEETVKQLYTKEQS